MNKPLATPHPNTEDFRVNTADWVELNCFFKADKNISKEDLKRALMRGAHVDDEKAQALAGDVFLELEDRFNVCGHLKNAVNSYPFFLNDTKTVLTVRYPFKFGSNIATMYWFLLLVSRLNMDSRARVLNSIDPTRVFEVLCADVLTSFWAMSKSNSGSFVFGTAARKKGGKNVFKQNIEQLCSHIGEGEGLRLDAQLPGGGDAKLDVVSWRKFNDGRTGNLIGFAQCKTGIHWKEHLDKLQPAKFARKYFQRPFMVEPVRIYMVPSRIEREQWSGHTDRAGILLDRCRLIQYGDKIGSQTLLACKTWSRAALAQQQKHLPKR